MTKIKTFERYGAQVVEEKEGLNYLFVYGIFLDQRMRDNYGMYNAHYATVPGWLTVGQGIVEAVRTDTRNAELTGLLVEVDPRHWDRLDALEAGYDRIIVKINGDDTYMYVGRGQL